jgi:hypothetical protein
MIKKEYYEKRIEEMKDLLYLVKKATIWACAEYYNSDYKPSFLISWLRFKEFETFLEMYIKILEDELKILTMKE